MFCTCLYDIGKLCSTLLMNMFSLSNKVLQQEKKLLLKHTDEEKFTHNFINRLQGPLYFPVDASLFQNVS